MSDPTGKNTMSLNMWGTFMSHNRMLCSVLNIKFLCHTISIPCAQWYKTSCINCPSYIYILHFVIYSKKHFISLSFTILGTMKSYAGLFRRLLGSLKYASHFYSKNDAVTSLIFFISNSCRSEKKESILIETLCLD